MLIVSELNSSVTGNGIGKLKIARQNNNNHNFLASKDPVFDLDNLSSLFLRVWKYKLNQQREL